MYQLGLYFRLVLIRPEISIRVLILYFSSFLSNYPLVLLIRE